MKLLEYNATLYYGFNWTLKIRSSYKFHCIKSFANKVKGRNVVEQIVNTLIKLSI